MSSGPESSAVRVDSDLREKIANARSGEEIAQLLHNAELEQGLRVPDVLNPDVLHETELSTHAARNLSRKFSVNGESYTVQGMSELELAAAENEIYKRIFAPPEDLAVIAVRVAEAARESREQEAAQSVKEYNDNWARATEEFKQRHPDWQGGDKARDAVGAKLHELGLTESPSVESLERAYQELKRTNSIPANPAIAAAKKQHEAILAATTPEELRVAAGLDPYRGYDKDFSWR